MPGDWLEIAQAIAPVVASLMLVGGGALAYRRQKRIDRYEELVKKRREVYVGLLTEMTKSFVAGGTDSPEFEQAKCEVFIYGSDLVISKFKALIDIPLETNELNPQQMRAFAALVHAIRQDCFEASRLTVDQLARLTIPPKRSAGTSRLLAQGGDGRS